MWFSWQEAESHRQSLQEAIYQAQQSRQVARDGGGGGGGGGGGRGGGGKPNMTHSLCRKGNLADSFIPCVLGGGWGGGSQI